MKRLRCSGLWPNCCPPLSVQRQSYRAGRVVRKDQHGRCPWFQARGPSRWRAARSDLYIYKVKETPEHGVIPRRPAGRVSSQSAFLVGAAKLLSFIEKVTPGIQRNTSRGAARLPSFMKVSRLDPPQVTVNASTAGPGRSKNGQNLSRPALFLGRRSAPAGDSAVAAAATRGRRPCRPAWKPKQSSDLVAASHRPLRVPFLVSVAAYV